MPDYKPFRPKDYPYPATLEAKYWDKKKSLRAKIAGETGVGDALKAAENAYKKVDWDALDLGTHFHGNKFDGAGRRGGAPRLACLCENIRGRQQSRPRRL